MWRTKSAITENPTIQYTIANQVSAENSTESNQGIRIDSGTANVSYPIRLNAQLPSMVQPGESFTLDTSSWLHLPSQLTTTGPEARFTLDAIFELSATVGPGSLTAVGFEVVSIPQALFSIPPPTKYTLIDIGSGAPGRGSNFLPGPTGLLLLLSQKR